MKKTNISEAGAPETAVDVPEGFAVYTQSGPFAQHNGPFFEKRGEGGLVRAFRVEQRHLNGAGIVHGGMLMAFADSVLGRTVSELEERGAVTVRMTSDFVHPAHPGDWIEGRATVTRKTSSLVFVRGEITSRGRVLMTADGVFAFVKRRRTGKAEPGEV